jgi:hypothetical protein
MLLVTLVGTGEVTMAENISPAQMSDKLRSMVLHLNPSDIGIERDNFPHPVYAVLMETGLPDGSYSLSAVADGSTSLYFSEGGGIIGGGEYENVRKAAGYFLSDAQQYYRRGQKAENYPRPGDGMVFFYFVTFDGVYTYSASEDNLGNERDKLSNLFFSAHNVIAELRDVEKKSRNQSE